MIHPVVMLGVVVWISGCGAFEFEAPSRSGSEGMPPGVQGCFYDTECVDGWYCGDERVCHEVPECETKTSCENSGTEGCVYDAECGEGAWCDASLCAKLPSVLDPCSTWSGPASEGNDPEAVFRVELCRTPSDPARLYGKSITESPRSGFSERALEGFILSEEELAIELWEIEITVDEPNPGWRFCTFDRYDLRLRVDKLVGTYVSEDCNDEGWVFLGLQD